MPKPGTHRSQRFAQAAKTERSRLARKRSQLAKKREDLQARVDALDAELEAVEQEIVVLENFALPEKAKHELREVRADDAGPKLLSGGAIRGLAIPTLMREQGTAPIHYRDWLALLERDGYRVAGKRPDAVFLNQVTRSPLVRATTRAGYYQLDSDAVEQLREKLRGQQAKLAELVHQSPTDPQGFEKQRQQERELNMAINRTQRELDEAMSAIDSWAPGGSQEAQAA